MVWTWSRSLVNFAGFLLAPLVACGNRPLPREIASASGDEVVIKTRRRHCFSA
jgi:hypothetical protein